MTELEKLIAVEEIKRLKAKYFYGIDNKDWDLWREEVFAASRRLRISARHALSQIAYRPSGMIGPNTVPLVW